MAYGSNPVPGINTPPSIDEFCREMEELIVRYRPDLEIGMTSEGRLVTRENLPPPSGGFLGYFSKVETFEQCQQNLKTYLRYQRNYKRLADRKIEPVPEEPLPTLDHTYRQGLSLQRAERIPFKDDANIYLSPGDNERVRRAPELRRGDLTMLGKFAMAKLGNQFSADVPDEARAEELVLELFKADKAAVLDLRDFMHTQDLNNRSRDQEAADKLDMVFMLWKFPIAETVSPAKSPEPPPPVPRQIPRPMPGTIPSRSPRQPPTIDAATGAVTHQPGGKVRRPVREEVHRPSSEVSNRPTPSRPTEAELIQSVNTQVGVSYFGVEQTRRLLETLSQLNQLNQRMAQQAFWYLSNQDLPPESRRLVDTFNWGAVPQGREPERIPEPVAAPPRQRLSPSKYMEDQADQAKALQGQGRHAEAFEVYRQIVENCDRNDNPNRYDKSVRSMSDIWRDPEVPEVDNHTYDMNRMIVHLEIMARNGDAFYAPQLVELLVRNNDEQRRKRLGQRLSRKMTRQTGQHSYEYTESGPMKMRNGHLKHYVFQRYDKHTGRTTEPQYRVADVHQSDVPDMDDDFIRGNIHNPEVPAEELKNLEYRVEPDPRRVQEKIHRANQDAREDGQRQNPQSAAYRRFEPQRALRQTTFRRIEEPHSESSRHLPGAAVACAQGKRDNMEDTHIMDRFQFTAGGRQIPVSIAGVYDGHGGSKASRAVSATIIEKLAARLEQYNEFGLTEAGIWNALKLAMIDLDRVDLFYANGTTACTTLIIEDRIWTINVGDSRAMLAYPSGALQLSEDAKVSDLGGGGPDKFSRSVGKRGGMVAGVNVSGPLQFGMLSTARAIGDHYHGGAVSARGKVTSYPIDQDMLNTYLVIGCDGIYDVATSGQVAELINHHCRINPNITAEELAQEIASHSYFANSGDNLSVVVVPFRAMVSAAS